MELALLKQNAILVDPNKKQSLFFSVHIKYMCTFKLEGPTGSKYSQGEVTNKTPRQIVLTNNFNKTSLI